MFVTIAQKIAKILTNYADGVVTREHEHLVDLTKVGVLWIDCGPDRGAVEVPLHLVKWVGNVGYYFTPDKYLRYR